MNAVTPPPATRGDEVAIVAPSSTMSSPVIEIGVQRLQNHFNLSPIVYPSAEADDPLSPAERAADIHRAFESEATAIFAVTGGEDQIRLYRHLDRELLRSNPTRYFSISDNTVLHTVLSEAEVVSYYGGQFVPGIAYDGVLPDYTRRYLERALFNECIGEIEPAPEWTDEYFDFESDKERHWEPNEGWVWEFPTDNAVTGTVWGGCLTVLEHVLAANQAAPGPEAFSGAILVLETSELLPEPYYVRSVIRCLGERGILSRCAAVMVGRPKTRHKQPRSHEKRQQYWQRQRAAIRDTCHEYVDDLPIVFDVDFGHTDPGVPIPIGGSAHLDPATERIRFV